MIDNIIQFSRSATSPQLVTIPIMSLVILSALLLSCEVHPEIVVVPHLKRTINQEADCWNVLNLPPPTRTHTKYPLIFLLHGPYHCHGGKIIRSSAIRIRTIHRVPQLSPRYRPNLSQLWSLPSDHRGIVLLYKDFSAERP